MVNNRQLEISFPENDFQKSKPLITKVCETSEENLKEILNWNLSNIHQTSFTNEDLKHLWKYVWLKNKNKNKKNTI